MNCAGYFGTLGGNPTEPWINSIVDCTYDLLNLQHTF